jgi:hypothetical protein
MKPVYVLIGITLLLWFAAVAPAQDGEAVGIDVSAIPANGDRAENFAPRGWKVEAVAKGDLNGDGRVDQAITLIQDIPRGPKDEPGPDRARALVVALADGNSLRRAGVADRLLQCTSCGGAFYGIVDAPAGVTIAKGVIVVGQDHGSRDISESTFRFRWDAASGRFVLIGYDYNGRDRLTGEISKESTNYVTNQRITTTGKGRRLATKRTTIKPAPIFLEDAVADEIEYAALERLGLG